ncbi:MAG: nucleoside phosphorylase [Chloroflexi bacterium]|nr:nucleoside phosphorylase [Chloroflexota bacterium]
MHFPLLEYDPANPAIIEPAQVFKRLDTMPEYCVLCFFQEVIQKVCAGAEVVKHLKSEIGPNPVYALHVQNTRIAIAHPGIGAPMSAAILDELIAFGCRKFIACGGSGVLNREIAAGHVVVPDAALRDEGTSFHYLPPAREVAADAAVVQVITHTLTTHQIPYTVGKTWTTDAIYRETPAKVARRKAEGCITVEMEAAAFFAVAQFRGVRFGQILYGGDDVSGETWDPRGWHKNASSREKLFWLAVEAVVRL